MSRQMGKAKKKMLISQPEPSSGRSPYFSIAERFGYDIDFRQLIQTVPIDAVAFRKQRIDPLSYTAFVFTSKTAIDCFFTLLKSMRLTVPETMKYFCSSEKIALYLQKYIVYRKRKIFFGEMGHTDELVRLMSKPSHKGERFLIPVGEDGISPLVEQLEGTNFNYKSVVAYETITRPWDDKPDYAYDLVIFFSPYGISAMEELFPDFNKKKILIGAFGKLTEDALVKAGMQPDFTAPTPEYPSMAGALEAFLASHAEA